MRSENTVELLTAIAVGTGVTATIYYVRLGGDISNVQRESTTMGETAAALPEWVVTTVTLTQAPRVEGPVFSVLRTAPHAVAARAPLAPAACQGASESLGGLRWLEPPRLRRRPRRGFPACVHGHYGHQVPGLRAARADVLRLPLVPRLRLAHLQALRHRPAHAHRVRDLLVAQGDLPPISPRPPTSPPPSPPDRPPHSPARG